MARGFGLREEDAAGAVRHSDSPPGNDFAGGPPHQADTAQYVSDMLLGLRQLVKSAQLHQLMKPLEEAYYQAFSAANRIEVPRDQVDRLRQVTNATER